MSSSAKLNLASTTSPLTVTAFALTGNDGGTCFGVYINTTISAHAVNITDFDNSVSPNTTRTLAVIPASAAAGSTYEFPNGLRARNTLRIETTNAAATGDITVTFNRWAS